MPFSDDSNLSTVLTSIQVNIAAMRGEIGTLSARLEGKLESQQGEMHRIRSQMATLALEAEKEAGSLRARDETIETRVDGLEKWQWKIMGASGAVATGIALVAKLWHP